MLCTALFRGIAAMFIAAAPVAAALGADSGTSAAIEERADALEPGQFVWDADGAPQGPVQVVISLADQRALVYRGGQLIGASTISSGREGYESPIGRFQILEKRRIHRSNRYNSAPMPFMQRLNWYGVALHAGEIPGYPASHGCIRLPRKFAKKLYGLTSHATLVTVTDRPFRGAKAKSRRAKKQASA